MDGWHFLSVPKSPSTKINAAFAHAKRGWGSLPVEAKVGKTAWNTSIFPDKKSGTYVLPLKAAVRKKEGLDKGDSVSFSISIRA